MVNDKVMEHLEVLLGELKDEDIHFEIMYQVRKIEKKLNQMMDANATEEVLKKRAKLLEKISNLLED